MWHWAQKPAKTRWPAAGVYLRERTGHDFPLLGKLQSRRAVKQDLKRDKETRARLGSIEKTIKKEQAPAKKTTATTRAVRSTTGSH